MGKLKKKKKGCEKMKKLKDLVNDDLTPVALILIGAGVIVEGYNSFGVTRLGLLQMSVGAIIVLAGVGWYYVQKQFKTLKR